MIFAETEELSGKGEMEDMSDCPEMAPGPGAAVEKVVVVMTTDGGAMTRVTVGV